MGDIPLVIVGNKSDLSDERAVMVDEAMKFAQDFGAEYIEASALKNENVNEAFELLISKVLTSDASIGFGSGSGLLWVPVRKLQKPFYHKCLNKRKRQVKNK